MRRYKLLLALAIFLAPAVLSSGESPRRAGQQLIEQNQAAQGNFVNQLQPLRYNQHPAFAGSSQFRRRVVGPPDEAIPNALGNGIASDYFCSGEDEAYAYSRHNQLRRLRSYAASGTYNSILQEDTCRTLGGCGEIEPDNKCFIFSLPTHATNCHPLGRKRVWDRTLYENLGDTSATAPRNASHESWQGRNYVQDQYGFLFGRYLINQVSCPAPEASTSPVAPLMEVTIPIYSNTQYTPLGYSRPFMDIPYSLNHLKWGFTCGILSQREAYHQKNRLFRTFWGGYTAGDGDPMDNEHKDHYKTLLAMANNRLCKKVGEGTFGNFNYAYPTTRMNEMKGIVVPVCQILREMIDRIPGDCGDQGCSTLRFWANALQGKSVDLRKGGTANGTFIEFRPEQEAIFLESPVYNDCLSKRASNSSPTYNISGPIGGRCYRPSYAQWSGGGLFENEFDSTRGFNLQYAGSGSSRTVNYLPGGLVSAKGYSPIVIARLAHELIHAWYLEEKGKTLDGWPASPEAINEEQIAVLGQALIYYYLCDLGFCPKSFAMEKREFVRGHTASDGAIRGFRFLYANECRGYEGIFLGPFCNNMFTMAHFLISAPARENRHEPEIARMLALWHANAPTLEPPAFRTVGNTVAWVNGVQVVQVEEGPFAYLPMHGPTSGSSNIWQQNQQTTQIQQAQPMQTNPPGSMSDDPFPPGQGSGKEKGKGGKGK